MVDCLEQIALVTQFLNKLLVVVCPQNFHSHVWRQMGFNLCCYSALTRFELSFVHAFEDHSKGAFPEFVASVDIS